MSNELPSITVKEFILWALRQRRRFRVMGNSMLPLLRPGDTVLITTQPNPRLAANDIVVAYHPLKSQLKIIKRVASIQKNNSLILSGDNPQESTDSRIFGPTSPKNIIGRVTCRF